VAYPYWLWPNVPTGIVEDPSRLWDWNNMEIFRDFNAGTMPIKPIESLRAILSKI
jgi:hypothetical protein